MFDEKTINSEMPFLKVVKIFPVSGQKQVYLVEHDKYGITILKIVKEMDERITREIQIVTDNNLANVPQIIETSVININNDNYFLK